MVTEQPVRHLPKPAQQPERQPERRRWRIVGIILLVLSLLLTLSSIVDFVVLTRAPATGPRSRSRPQAIIHAQQPSPTTAPSPTVAATPTQNTAQLTSQVDSLFTNKVSGHQFSGSVLIAQNGQVLFSKGYSMANWDNNTPNTPQTRFHIGSLTKQFTASAIMILQERGKLHVHDPLCNYLPYCPAAWRPLTIHHLLTHTSGIPQLDNSRVSIASPTAFIASYNGVPLAFTPGSQYSYCSVCFQILGIVVERASGQPYSTFIQQTILTPLQMNSSGFFANYSSMPDHSIGYASWQLKADDLGWSVAPNMSFLFASGLLVTTVKDLYRWDQGLYAHTVISQQSLDQMYTPYVSSEFPTSSYGYGWFIAKPSTPHYPYFWHYGSIDGFRAYIGRYPTNKVTIIILSNLAAQDIVAFAGMVEQTVFANL
ncbi:MAG: beta-lactamase family protein [Chloroflexota bacterium]|nr:beta-lactamase family protein [Chloroflexota bacterium]